LVSQADPPTTGLHNTNQRRDKEKVTDHMRVKIRKTDIKLKYNFMNIIANRARQKVPTTWYDIGGDRLYRKSMTHS
jgi:hypothetical protein